MSAKQLYQRFMRQVEGNTINFITQGQANRGGQQMVNYGKPAATNQGAASGGDDEAFN